jgi:hypothetical protein
MKTTFGRTLVIILLTLIAYVVVMWCLQLFMPGGRHFFRRVGRVEVLNAPAGVRQITPGGLVLENGSLVKIPYVEHVPTNLAVLVAAVSSGVEIDKDGHVIGLIKVWHWCGNDPIRSHIGRIDLTGLLLFAGATPTQSVPTNAFPVAEKINLTEWGLDISQYMRMQTIPTMIEMLTEPTNIPYSSPAPQVQKR